MRLEKFKIKKFIPWTLSPAASVLRNLTFARYPDPEDKMFDFEAGILIKNISDWFPNLVEIFFSGNPASARYPAPVIWFVKYPASGKIKQIWPNPSEGQS